MMLPARRTALGVALGVLLAAGTVRAACNVIPPALPTIPSTLGNIDRPYARPGDWVGLSLDPTCGSSPGFAANDVITVVFAPPGGGPRNAVVHQASCVGFEGSPAQAACQAQLGTGGRAFCSPLSGGSQTNVVVPDAQNLRFRFTDSDAFLGLCNGGLNDNRLCTTDAQCGGGTCDRASGEDDDLTLAGPATIAVTANGAPLACGATCASQTGLHACIDDLREEETCNGPAHAIFPHFTALPSPNDYQALCTNPVPPCTGLQDDVRFTVDTAGNILIPMDWRGVLVGRVCLGGANDGNPCADDTSCPGGACRFRGVPIARFLRASSAVEAYEGRGAPILIPDLTVLNSFSPEGVILPPLFDPQGQQNATSTATFFGSADAPETVLRVARHNAPRNQCAAGANVGLPCTSNAQCAGDTCAAPRCVGGSNANAACSLDGDCPGGECGPGLFDFTTRLAGDVGPVLLRLDACIGGTNALAPCTSNAQCPGGQCGSFTVAALDPGPLDGLNQTDVLNAFVMDEAIENRQYNGDADTVDVVVKLGDRATGLYQSIGNGAEGLATVRVRDGSFTFPALTADDDVIAFLESESAEGYTDFNDDLDRFDFRLRAFRLGSGSIGGAPLADPAPLVNGRSAVISNGRVFYRRAEAALVTRTSELVSATPDGSPGDGLSNAGFASADGRWVAFDSMARDLTAVPETLFDSDVYLRDRNAPATIRITSGGGPGGFATVQAISPNGRFVLYKSGSQVYVYDHANGMSELASAAAGGGPANGISDGTQVTDDGRFVVFHSDATDLTTTPDTNGEVDVFLRDRQASPPFLNLRVSVGTGGVELADGGVEGQLGGQKRYIAFAQKIAGGPILLHDRITATTSVVSVSPSGGAANAPSSGVRLSLDGTVVAFSSDATNLVPGDTNDATDTFIRDVVGGRTQRVSAATGGAPSGGGLIDLGSDGRNVFFTGSGLVPGADPMSLQLYVHDRLTATTELLLAQPAALSFGRPSADARFVPYRDTATPSQSRILIPIPAPDAVELFLDDAFDDTVLESLELSNGMATTLCPATDVVVAAGRAAFLRPEVETGTADCPGGALNADPLIDEDGNLDSDSVVQLWTGPGAVQNLGLAASKIAMSDTWLAALVSESQEQTSLNGDGLANTDVLHVRPADGTGSWTNVMRAGDSLAMAGDVVAFTVPEAQETHGSTNPPDADTADSVLFVYRAGNGMLIPTGLAARGVVVGETGLVAFRTLEAEQNGMTLNGDADATDGVLNVYDPATGDLILTQMAVIPCPLEACDPRLPFRVLKDTVRFLTLECDQGGSETDGCPTGGTDLNGDGDAGDLILQMLNVKQAGNGDMDGARHTLGATAAGVCTSTGRACVTSADCGTGTCFVPPGGCDRDLATACTPPSEGMPSTCPSGQYCRPITGMPGTGTCHIIEGPCAAQTDCTPGAICNAGTNSFIITPPFTGGGDEGSGAFIGVGHCIEDFGTSCATTSDCPSGEFCDNGTCHRDHGVCKDSGDCPPGSVCEQDLVAATISDSDGDEIPDPVDNCPAVANILQTDGDADGVGDACETVVTCGTDTGTRPKVLVKTVNGIGLLRSKWEVPFAGYAGAPVSVTLSDGDGTIATQSVGTLPPKGASGKLWQFQATGIGVQQVRLRNLAPRKPGRFQVKTKAKHWFTAGQADEAAASTVLTVDVGGQCFTQAATKKVD